MANVTGNVQGPVSLGEAVRSRRRELGMTTEVCAVKAGVAVKTLLRVERGEDVKFGTLERIAEALDLSLPDLVALRAS